MQYGYLGASGLRVSKICLGTMHFGGVTPEDEAHAIMDRALEALSRKINEGKLGDGYAYSTRTLDELGEMRSRGMFPFVRCLLYVTDQFHKEGVVWGVGRGSSCASLVMFLLRINRIDPVKYGIPAEEFFK